MDLSRRLRELSSIMVSKTKAAAQASKEASLLSSSLLSLTEPEEIRARIAEIGEKVAEANALEAEAAEAEAAAIAEVLTKLIDASAKLN